MLFLNSYQIYKEITIETRIKIYSISIRIIIKTLFSYIVKMRDNYWYTKDELIGAVLELIEENQFLLIKHKYYKKND